MGVGMIDAIDDVELGVDMCGQSGDGLQIVGHYFGAHILHDSLQMLRPVAHTHRADRQDRRIGAATAQAPLALLRGACSQFSATQGRHRDGV